MLGWLLLGDGDVVEIDVDVDGVLLLPDDKLISIIELIDHFVKDVDNVGKEQ